jgi:hypothetical protein
VAQIVALQQELRALRRLLRLSKAAAQAAEARARREDLMAATSGGGPHDAA